MKPFALIIHGDPEQAQHYKKALAGAGFQVNCVTTGARAQVELTFTAPDLVVLDMLLPDIPGEVVLRQIRASHRLRGTRLILLSASKSKPDAEQPAQLYVLERAVSAARLASIAEGMNLRSEKV